MTSCSNFPSRKTCFCPTTSSSVRGRMRSASGVVWLLALPRRAAASSKVGELWGVAFLAICPAGLAQIGRDVSSSATLLTPRCLSRIEPASITGIWRLVRQRDPGITDVAVYAHLGNVQPRQLGLRRHTVANQLADNQE